MDTTISKWKLITATDVECTMDDSCLYVNVHRIEETITHKEYAGTLVHVRADLMTSDNLPVVSFIGSAANVRKHLIRYIGGIQLVGQRLSAEHASYIGAELQRAESDSSFVQD